MLYSHKSPLFQRNVIHTADISLLVATRGFRSSQLMEKSSSKSQQGKLFSSRKSSAVAEGGSINSPEIFLSFLLLQGGITERNKKDLCPSAGFLSRFLHFSSATSLPFGICSPRAASSGLQHHQIQKSTFFSVSTA